MKRRHPLLARLVGTLLLVVLTIAALEIALRVYVGLTTTTAAGRDTDEAGAIQPMPESLRRYAMKPSLGPPLNTNAQGFRGEPVEVPKPAGVRRILMLGDSVTFGNSVSWNQTFSYVLEQLLNEGGRGASPDSESGLAPLPQGSRWEVLNLGVSGYNTAQELATLREVGLGYEPDLIVLNVCLNDSDPVKTLTAIGLRNEVGVRDSGDFNVRTIIETSYLLTFLKYGLVSTFQKHPRILRFLNAPEVFINVRATERRWSDMKADMGVIFGVARGRGIPVAVVIYPYSAQIGMPAEKMVPQQDLLAFAAASDVPALDVSGAYVNQPQDMFVDDFLHLSAYGHRTVAAAIREFLVSRGLLQKK